VSRTTIRKTKKREKRQMLIGLHGKAKHGKDTSCGILRDHLAEVDPRLPTRRDAFADRLKLSAAAALGFEGTVEEAVAFCERLKHPKTYITVSEYTSVPTVKISGREYLQYYGTEAHRDVFDQAFWVNAVMDTYDPQEVLIITDVRFVNEAEAVRERGGEVWHVIRPELEEIAESSHASEQVLPAELIDRTIYNDASLEVLRDRLVWAWDDAFLTV
jgi:hypothetical protein